MYCDRSTIAEVGSGAHDREKTGRADIRSVERRRITAEVRFTVGGTSGESWKGGWSICGVSGESSGFTPKNGIESGSVFSHGDNGFIT
jgi:hypothetical protein